MSLLFAAAAALVIDGGIDVHALAAVPELKKGGQRLLLNLPPRAHNLLEELGFRPLRDLKSITFRVAQPLPKGKPEALAVVGGRFRPQRIHSAWAKNKDPGKPKRQKLLGRQSYLEPGGEQVLVVDSSKRLVFGNRPVVERFLKGKPVLAKKRPPFLRRAPIWVWVKLPKGARQALAKKDPASPLQEIHEVQAKLALVGKKVRAEVRLRCASASSANGLNMMLSMALANSAKGPAAALRKHLKTRVQGSSLVLSVKASLAELKALAQPRSKRRK